MTRDPLTPAGMTPETILRLRLAGQQITRSRCPAPGAVVAWLGAIQAQDYAGALWSVGLRLPGSTAAGIGQAVAGRTLVRTWLLRGTLHLVTARDLRWMLALLAPGIIAGNRRRYRELALDEETFARSNAVIREAVEGGQHLSRTGLVAILEQHGIPAGGQRAPYLLQRASLDGIICQGAPQGTNPVFFSCSSLPEGNAFGHEAALAELARRYIASHAPATLRDFAAWSGLPVDEARAGLGAAGPHLSRKTVDGRTWFLPRPARAEEPPAATVHLLPGFDEYILGYRERCALPEDPTLRRRVLKNGMLSPTILSSGRVAGTWRRIVRNGTVRIVPAPFSPLTGAEKDALAVAAHRYGEFLGMSVLVEEAVRPAGDPPEEAEG
jgi:hypothetical protein